MPTGLSYGYNKPVDGDPGDVWDDTLEGNWTRMSTHNHDGVNSAPIAATRQTVSYVSGGWVAQGGGTYRMGINMPGGYPFNTTIMRFNIGSGGDDNNIFYPTVEKISDTSFYIYGNDNTIDVDIVYM